MARRLKSAPSRGSEDLAERIRSLRNEARVTPAARRRLNSILSRIGSGAERAAIQPADLAESIAQAIEPTSIPTTGQLNSVVNAVMEGIRLEVSDALPQKPITAGNAGADVPLTSKAFSQLIQLAATDRSEGQDSVVWDDGVNELIVHASRTKAVIKDGEIRIDIPVAADGLRTTMQIPFAVGSKERVAGLVVATLSRPAGPPVISQIWGDALLAFAYGSLMDVVASVTGALGHDTRNDRLVPRALIARRGRLTIETQARFRFKGQSR